MLTPDDFIYLPYTGDLNLAGLAYACRSLHYTYDRMQTGSATQPGRTHRYTRLQRIIGGKAAELALRRHLIEQSIPFDNLGATPFTDPDHYDIALGGRRCDLKSFLVLDKERVQKIQQQPKLLLQASALVPESQAMSAQLTDNDLLIFAFVTARLTEKYSEAQALQANGQPVYWIYLLPDEWGAALPWSSLGEVALKSELDAALQIELGGQGRDHRFLTEHVNLTAKKRLAAQLDFHTLLYLHTNQPPQGRVGISSARLEQTLLIKPPDWVNTWIYGMQVILAGYITRREFNHQARRLPSGSRVFQYTRTRTPNLAVPVTDLHPLGELYQKVKDWAR